MRLHHLEATAFGPFAHTVTVDFDDLSAAGVFLLTGPTGAGKSSVLDAVCFALYGQVPGDREDARHLHSDLASPTQAPRVVLDLSVGSRRFRFTRSPRWTRPKKRGHGETTVQAHVLVEELRPEGWVGLATRLDEAGLLVSDLLGMTCAQFTQVALLPQGRFMAFLRATSAERQAVLQKLFRTVRFEQVERWLVDRRIELRRVNQAANDRVAAVLNRLQEAADASVPAEWDLHDLVHPAGRNEPTAWTAELVSEVEAAFEAAATGAAVARAHEESAREALRLGEELTRARARGLRARTRLAHLDERADEIAASRERLARHDRARPVHAPAARSTRARADLSLACDQLARLTSGQECSEAELAERHEAALVELARLEEQLPREAELRRRRTDLTGLRARLRELEEQSTSLQRSVDALPVELAELRADLDAARLAQASLATLDEARESAADRVRAAERLEAATAELVQARSDLGRATALAFDRREEHLSVREARINGMAAELAGALALGCSCPVCGSADHPAPASRAEGAVTRSDEEAARRRQDEAEFDKQLREHRVVELSAECDRLAETTEGLDVSTGRRLVSEAETARSAARTLAETLPAVTAQEKALAAALERDRVELAAIREQVAATTATAAETTRLVGELEDELAELSGAGTSVSELVTTSRHTVKRLAQARAAATSRAAAERSAREAEEAALEAAATAGFESVEDALAATVAEAEAIRIAETLQTWANDHREATGVLAEEEVQAALEQPEPDLDSLRAACEKAVAAAETAATTAATLHRRRARLVALGAELAQALAAWAPLREDLETVARLAALVEGKGPDNPQRIRLSAYVLGERLRQVVEAANVRLHGMTDGRYSLEHTDDKGAGEQRGGLSLRVRDDWTGRTRDPATLSGGETFVVSLALALGLADTVCHEAGGADIDTLFIDEGFGALDADTLDDVMDTLDSLRDGGRVVGLVSHVPELRSRIPTQLEIRKDPRGSTVHRPRRDG